MQLRTTVPVKFNSGLFGELEKKLYLVIRDIHYLNKFSYVNIDYHYETRESHDVPSHQNANELVTMEVPRVVYSSTMRIDSETINEMYNQVKNSIPSGLSETEHQEYKFYAGAKLKMFEALAEKNPSLTMSQIELVS